MLFEQSFELVVLDVDGQAFFGFLVNESGDGSQGLPWFPVDAHRVELKIFLDSHPQEGREASKRQWVSILEENNPLFPSLIPGLNFSM